MYSDADRDGIQFSSGWNHDDTDSKHYRGTYTSTDLSGSYMMLSFRGTSIGYYADKSLDSGVAILAIDGRPFNATWRDQNVTTTVQRQQQMWMAVGLHEGDHQLVLGTVPSYMNSTGTVGLDYFSIIPVTGSDSVTPIGLGPGSSVVPSNAVIVDNDDPSIVYSDASWRKFVNYGPPGASGFSGPTPLYFNNTQRSSLRPGSTATFTFHGTDVWYFCDDYWGNANVSISVDGGEGEEVDTSTPAVSWVSQKLWWSKTGLSSGKHTVTITHVGRTTEYANVDFFMYIPTAPSHGLSKAMIGTIVGAVIAGVVVLFGLILLGVFIYRRKRSTNSNAVAKADVPEADTKEPGVHMVTLKKRGSDDTLATTANLDEKISDEIAPV
ncbi:hypothetical protein FRC07_010634 [Ceratobasidium sp. 392]|nr:hypothetical protein FRC07_010634 [Ceratobasidium sp. 392]